MAEANGGPLAAKNVHVRIANSSPSLGVELEFDKKLSVSNVEMSLDENETGVDIRHHFENGGSIPLHYPSKVAKPMLRSLIQMLTSLEEDSQLHRRNPR
jgi:hypothetical protein